MNEAKSKYYCLDTYTNAYKNQNDFADKKTSQTQLPWWKQRCYCFRKGGAGCKLLYSLYLFYFLKRRDCSIRCPVRLCG